MRFTVQHLTQYRYSVPVALAPHVLRLTPRAEENHLLSRTLVIDPQPLKLCEQTDAFGNRVTEVTFGDRPSDHLIIDSRFELETQGVPLRSPSLSLVPLPWVDTGGGRGGGNVFSTDDLSAYRQNGAPVDPGVATFAWSVAAEAGHQPMPFLDRLCATLYARTDRHVRPTGNAQSAAETLATWRGACRDITVLYLAAARSLGLAGRFCSGYQAAAETPDGRHYLHAWPEIFVPGLGWRGWDPTHGVPAGEGHVALCAASDQAGTMPVVGGYYFGDAITATLDFEVRIATR